MTFEYKYDANTQSDEEKLEELKDYMKALEEVQGLEMRYYNYSNRADKEDDILETFENELTAKKTEYTNAGGTFD